jgi:radical SAM superfamily enzyme YgiQ (UPF0313 family)
VRVLLVQSYLGRKGVADQLVYPIGLSCIATALAAAGHEPWIIDLNVGEEEAYDRLEREIRQFEPDAVGVSQRNIDSTTRKAPFVYHTELKPTLEIIRKAAPNAPAILGGPGFTQAAQHMMERYDYDFGIKSEAEVSFVELLANLDDPSGIGGVFWRKDGELVFNGEAAMPEFSALPYPKRHYIDWDLYRSEERRRGIFLDIGIESTRGCPLKCAYCNYPMLNGVKLRRKPPEVVVDEIEYLQNTFDIPQFTFTDSRFNLNKKHAIAICEEILRRGIKIRWIAWLGFRGVDEEFLALMVKAGCYRTAFSADGLLQPSLDRMRKMMTKEDIDNTIRAVRRTKGMKASWSFFLTPPDTSHKEQLLMLWYYFYIHGSVPGRGRMTLNWCRVEEHTWFEKVAREDGFLDDSADLLPDNAADLEALFYEAPGFEGWSRFWDEFLEVELKARTLVGRVTRPLQKHFGFKDLTPDHLKGRPDQPTMT